jgi:FlaA1/EpsC-like NDP-sugar epimerase
MKNLINSLSRTQKKLIVFIGDLILNISASLLSLILRLEKININIVDHIYSFVISFIVFLFSFYVFKIYRNIFRFFNLELIKYFLYATILSVTIYFFIVITFPLIGLPRSLAIIQPIIFFLLVCMFRIFVSYVVLFLNKESLEGQINILIYGAGSGGNEFVTLFRNRKIYKVLGFIDDSETKIGSYLNGIKIYSKNDIQDLVNKHAVNKIYITIPSLDNEKRRLIFNNLLKYNIEILSLPKLEELNDFKFDLDNFSKIKFEDLIGRNINLKYNYNSIFKEKTILVTGAGGSIGSEVSTQVFKLSPKEIILLDNSEFNIYSLQKKFESYLNNNNIKVTFVLCSIVDKKMIDHYFEKHKPDFVFHAAAFKHVNILENASIQAVNTNIFGTNNLINSSISHNVQKFIFVSTDKAVNPTSIMGITKRFSEILIQSYSKLSSTKFAIVRFGNVVGSSGSVIPLFLDQIQNRKNITITHPDVERYFMSISEAASLIISTINMNDESAIYLLDMGESIKIIDIARKLIQINGLKEKTKNNPDGDIMIEFIGLKKGEKLFEELFKGEIQKTSNKSIFRVSDTIFDKETVNNTLNDLKSYSDKLENKNIEIVLRNIAANKI